MPHRQRAWSHLLATSRAAGHAFGTDHTDRLTQCGGDEGGVFLTATVSEAGTSLADAEFCTGLRMRIGKPVCPPGHCQHRSRRAGAAGRPCGAQLDPDGKHAVECKIGGEVNVLHDGGCTILLGAARAAGYAALAEQVVPELRSATKAEPRLDIDAWGVPSQPRLLLDFTVRDPAAKRYEAHRGEEAGTARQGEKEKATTYPPAGGCCVTGVCMERLGRHGPNLASLLHDFADLARRRDSDRGLAPKRWLRLWRVQLSCAAVRSSHRAIATAAQVQPARCE